MGAEENYKALRAELDKRLKADKRLEAIASKIAKGKADFNDTSRYSHIVSQYMGEVISEYIGEMTMPLGKEYVCKALLREHYDRINDVLGEVQASVDDKLGIHLKPVTAPFPTERVDAAAHSLEDPTVPEETIKRRARSATENIANSMHDDYIKENAKTRTQAGLKCYLVRDAGGGCCKWCQALAGRYDYATAPDDIFRRHDNCTCTVTYECGRQRQDVWSKKTWEASEDELKARKEAEAASKPVVNSKEQAKELEARVLDKSKNNGIIKNIELSDIASSIQGGKIKEEVAQAIFDTLNELDAQKLFDDVVVIKTDSAIVMQTDPVRKGTFFDTKLNLNENFLGGKSVEQIDKEIKDSPATVANSLREAVIHEIYHAKLINGLNQDELDSLYEDLSEMNIAGVSKDAFKDGSECIAEVGVLFERNDTDWIPQKAKELFSKYMGVLL